MSDFDTQLKQALSESDERFITDTIDETGYYKAAFSSLRGQGAGLRIAVWVAVLICSGLLFFSIWKFFQVDTVKEQIFFAALAIMLNSGQIAFKMWFNMQLNRRAIIKEIKRLQFLTVEAMQNRS